MEWLTNEMEEQAYRYFEKIDHLGGVLSAIKQGYLQREIANTSYLKTQQMENGKKSVVGVNKYLVDEEKPIKYLQVNPALQKKASIRLRALRRRRDQKKLKLSLEKLLAAFEDPEANSVKVMLEAVKSYATLQEIMDVGREAFGGWKEPVLA